MKTYVTIILTVTLFFAFSTPVFAHHECTPNTPENCTGGEPAGAPHMMGLNTMDSERVRFEPVAFEPIFVMSNTEIHPILVPAVTDYVRVWFDDTLIHTIHLGYKPTNINHDTWRDIGNKPISIPLWGYYEIDESGFLIHKGAGYQHVHRDFENTYYENPEKTIQRQLNAEKLRPLLPHLYQ